MQWYKAPDQDQETAPSARQVCLIRDGVRGRVRNAAYQTASIGIYLSKLCQADRDHPGRGTMIHPKSTHYQPYSRAATDEVSVSQYLGATAKRREGRTASPLTADDPEAV